MAPIHFVVVLFGSNFRFIGQDLVESYGRGEREGEGEMTTVMQIGSHSITIGCVRCVIRSTTSRND